MKCVHILMLINLLLISCPAFGQAVLKIHNADMLRQNQFGGRTVYGNVDIEYDIYRVRCDSAVVNKDMSHAVLFRNIQFTDTSRTIFCDRATLSETRAGRLAYLSGNVRIIESDLIITGKEASINEINNRITVTDSVIARYYEHPSILFSEDLVYETQNNIISSRTLDSVLYIDSLRYYRLFTDIFTYDTEKKLLTLENRFRIRSGEFKNAVSVTPVFEPENICAVARSEDLASTAFFSADRGSFYFDPLNFSVSGKPNLTRITHTENDTIFFNSDRLTYNETEEKGVATGNVRLKNNQLILTSGKAAYYTDGTVRLYHDPLITYSHHEISGDSMRIKTSDTELFPEDATVFGNPVYTAVPYENTPEEKNILKGRLMDLWFLNKEISKIIVSKEAEALYFIREDEMSPSRASNYLLGDTVEIRFLDGAIESVLIKGGCEGIYYPEIIRMNALKKIKK